MISGFAICHDFGDLTVKMVQIEMHKDFRLFSILLTPKFGKVRSLIGGSNSVKKSARRKEGFFRWIRQRSPRSAIYFRSASRLLR
jgi:hypothetical protein